MAFTRKELEKLYAVYNERKFVSPDPLELLYHYEDPLDREVVGLLASGLAYGRVNSILKSVEKVLMPMGQSPRRFVLQSAPADLRRKYRGFSHRFTTDLEIVAFLSALRKMLEEFGTVESCVGAGAVGGDLFGGICHLADHLLAQSPGQMNSLLPHPSRGSACKRLHLFLRWMVRRDNVDPGGWTTVRPSQLTVPLDTHLYRVSLANGLTNRKSADLVTAQEITAGFARYCPEDPVRYDFALTRAGIRGNNLRE